MEALVYGGDTRRRGKRDRENREEGDREKEIENEKERGRNLERRNCNATTAETFSNLS